MWWGAGDLRARWNAIPLDELSSLVERCPTHPETIVEFACTKASVEVSRAKTLSSRGYMSAFKLREPSAHIICRELLDLGSFRLAPDRTRPTGWSPDTVFQSPKEAKAACGEMPRNGPRL